MAGHRLESARSMVSWAVKLWIWKISRSKTFGCFKLLLKNKQRKLGPAAAILVPKASSPHTLNIRPCSRACGQVIPLECIQIFPITPLGYKNISDSSILYFRLGVVAKGGVISRHKMWNIFRKPW